MSINPITRFKNFDPGLKILISWLIFVTVSLFLIVLHPTITNVLMICIQASAVLMMPAIFVFGEKAWFLKSVALFFRDLTPVVLVDHSGKYLYSMAKTSIDGKCHAKTYYMTGVGDCILEPDGTINRNSEAIYIYFWYPLRKDERMSHVLINDLPDLDELAKLSARQRQEVLRKKMYDRL